MAKADTPDGPSLMHRRTKHAGNAPTTTPGSNGSNGWRNAPGNDGLLQVNTRANSSQEEDAGKTKSKTSQDAAPVLETLTHNWFRVAEDNKAIEGLLLFREQPRQVIVLVALVVAIFGFSYYHRSDDVGDNVRTGLFAGVLVFLVHCFLQARDGLMVRPHPGVWRIVHGCSVVYLVLLAAMAVQNRLGAITVMQFFFPEIGHKEKLTMLGEKLDCSINVQTLYRGVSSIWFVAHATGWWAKMCMFRDWLFCLVLGVAFELLELALQFLIPDFQECWWDSLFMDLFGANLLGMIVGHFTLRCFQTRTYDWSGKKEKKMGYVLFVLSQFTPITWQQYHWEVFSSVKRFVQVIFLMISCLLVELNAFFLMNALSIPKESSFNKIRLIILFLTGIPGVAEYYEYVANPKCKRLGQNAWMIFAITIFELLVSIKFAEGILFTDPPPADVLYPVLAFFSMFGLWMWLFFRKPTWAAPMTTPRPVRASGPGAPRVAKVTKWTALDVLFWVSFTPLLVLLKRWSY